MLCEGTWQWGNFFYNTVLHQEAEDYQPNDDEYDEIIQYFYQHLHVVGEASKPDDDNEHRLLYTANAEVNKHFLRAQKDYNIQTSIAININSELMGMDGTRRFFIEQNHTSEACLANLEGI